MRPAPGVSVYTPSPSVLRFLRSQSEQVGFFTPSTVQCRGTSAGQGRLQVVSTSTRSLTTTPRHQATIESSLFNLDFLRPAAKNVYQYPFPYANTQKPQDISRARFAHDSTDSQPLLRRLWKHKERKEKAALKPTDLPPLPSFLDEFGGTNIGRNKTGKPGNELKLRCTEFDINGNVTLMDGEFKKSELIAKVPCLVQ